MNTIKKCLHGVYLASTEEVRTESARYCSLCNPDVNADILLRRRPKSIEESIDFYTAKRAERAKLRAARRRALTKQQRGISCPSERQIAQLLM